MHPLPFKADKQKQQNKAECVIFVSYHYCVDDKVPVAILFKFNVKIIQILLQYLLFLFKYENHKTVMLSLLL